MFLNAFALLHFVFARVQPKGQLQAANLLPFPCSSTHPCIANPSHRIISLPPPAHPRMMSQRSRRKKRAAAEKKRYSQEAESKGICALATFQTITSITFISFPVNSRFFSFSHFPDPCTVVC